MKGLHSEPTPKVNPHLANSNDLWTFVSISFYINHTLFLPSSISGKSLCPYFDSKVPMPQLLWCHWFRCQSPAASDRIGPMKQRQATAGHSCPGSRQTPLPPEAACSSPSCTCAKATRNASSGPAINDPWPRGGKIRQKKQMSQSSQSSFLKLSKLPMNSFG